MLNLEMELTHLALADRHIQQAHEHIAEARQRIAAGTVQGRDLGESLSSLRTLEGTLSAFERHRALIVRTIEAIRSGKL